MSFRYFLQKAPYLPLRIRKRLREQGVGNFLAWCWYQLCWRLRERRLGINTAEHAYGIDVWNSGEGQWYDPIDHRCLDIILDHLQPSRDDVFLDYGCGLGRPIIFAALRPFGRVIGVEREDLLVDLCRKNVASARSRGRFHCEPEIVHQDAATWPVPHDVNRVLMYNAFIGRNLMRAVLEQLRQSLAAHPRELVLVFAPLLQHLDLLDDCPWLEVDTELPTAFWNHVRVFVYRARLDRIHETADAGADADRIREPVGAI